MLTLKNMIENYYLPESIAKEPEWMLPLKPMLKRKANILHQRIMTGSASPAGESEL